MSALADVLVLTRKMFDTPADFMAWSQACEVMTKEEEDQVGGGCPHIEGGY